MNKVFLFLLNIDLPIENLHFKLQDLFPESIELLIEFTDGRGIHSPTPLSHFREHGTAM